MKLVITSLLVIFIFSMGFTQNCEDEIARLKQENDSLRAEINTWEENPSLKIEKLFKQLNSELGENTQEKVANTDETRLDLLAKIKEKSEANYEKALLIHEQTDKFVHFLEEVKKEMVNRTGGMIDSKPGKPVGYRNKEITKIVLIEEGKGKLIRAKIEELLLNYTPYFYQNPTLKSKVLLDLSLEEVEQSGKTWEELHFEHMPLAAIFPLFRKFMNDATYSEIMILEYLNTL